MKFTVPSGPETIGPATGALLSNVQTNVPPEVAWLASIPAACAAAPLGVEVAVGVGVIVGHAGHTGAVDPTDTGTGSAVMPPELTLMQAHPSFRPVYRPPLLVEGGNKTAGELGGLLFEVQSVEGALVISAYVICWPFFNIPCALKLAVEPLVGMLAPVACAHAVGVGVGPEVFVGVTVGGGGPGQMFIPTRAKPGDGLAVGHSPGMKTPLLLNEPKQLFPPPQLAIVTARTNTATGATTSHSFHRIIEH